MNKSVELIENIEELNKTDEAVSRSLSRVQKHMNSNRELGIISSQRTRDDLDAGGDNHELTPKEHNIRHERLKKDIKEAGYSYTSVNGNYMGSHEKSLMVFGKEPGKDTGLHPFLMKMGHKYAQDSIIHKPYDSNEPNLHFTFSRNGNAVGDNFPLGRMRAQRTGKFGSTEIIRGAKAGKDGRTPPSKKGFAFSSGKEIKPPKPSRLKKSMEGPGHVKDNAVWPVK